MVRIREDHPQDDRARGRVHGDVSELKSPWQRILGTVLQNKLHPVYIRHVAAKVVVLQVALQPE
ncbi:hypothetical protein SDC9_189513 [bioreactor metagenome]|uniref:Uncharacterized protein n=1 Tax=bioreactor metagenome TaxID=1076179 RepID=A0A645HSD6_9ZZZZ